MRILDEISDKPLENIIIYLTYKEAQELKDSIEELLKEPYNNHTHITDFDSNREITLCVYDVNKLIGFDEISIRIIKNDT